MFVEELRNIDEDFYTILTVQSCRRGLPLLPCPKRGEVQEEEVSDEPEPDFWCEVCSKHSLKLT